MKVQVLRTPFRNDGKARSQSYDWSSTLKDYYKQITKTDVGTKFS